MVTPKLVFVLLVLGNTLATRVEFEAYGPSGKSLDMPINPGFKVTGGMFGDKELKGCASPEVEPCYQETVIHPVDIYLTYEDGMTGLKFTGTAASDTKTITLSKTDATSADKIHVPTDNAIKEKDFPLTFAPTEAKIIKTSAPEETAFTGCQDSATMNCYKAGTQTSKLILKAQLASAPVALTLTDGAHNSLQAKLSPCSAVAWTSHASNAIFASLAVLFFLH